MKDYNELAKTSLRKMSIEKLVELFETTTDNNDENVPRVRGWIMDVIEEKAPEGFDKWLESEMCEDNELKNFVLV